MRLLITGPPGAGKGTVSTSIAEHYDIPTISTGGMFRAAVASGSELGVKLGAIMASGALVPDDVTDAVVAARLAETDTAGGWLLDGYPRTSAQVATLDQILEASGDHLDAVVVLDVSDEVIMTRLLRRATIEGRADDTEDVIRRRLEVYRATTAPIVDAYEARGLVLRVDGEGTMEEVNLRLRTALVDRLGR